MMATKQTTLGKPKGDSVKAKSHKKPHDNFLMVGMGASAGGLEAFKEFFETMPDNPGMAFILVQHLDPTHKSMLVELLSNYTKMKVSEVKDRTKVEPNHVYVIPPNKDMAIMNGLLHLMVPAEERGHRRPIDFFLQSLADDQKERAVGIILSGTGTEGTLSLKAIKGESGLTIVQDPETAKYDGMPRSAAGAGSADFILPISKMPEQILKYSGNRKIIPSEKITESIIPNSALEKIFILLRNATGCNFNNYKSNTVIRRIEKRMAINQVKQLDDYLKFLQKNHQEVISLFNELLIGVTNFFRDEEAFNTLAEKGISDILKKKSNGDVIRVWVLGCSTGEEAYSLAILFNEAISKQKKDLRLQIFASDIDEKAINSARIGIYPESISAHVNASRLKRFFQVESGAFRIKKEIRDQIIFAEQNILKDPPFSKLDMLSCRNLLIYLNPDAQQKIFSIFHYSLNPDGVLFLGNSESLGESSDLFTALDRKQKIFKRKNVKLDKRYDFHVNERVPIPKISPSRLKSPSVKDNLGGITERILLAKYAPPCAIINWKGDAVYFSGDTGKYLHPAPGMASLNIIDMARDSLKSDLRTVISKVRKSNNSEHREGVKVKTNEAITAINIIVKPIPQLDPDEHLLMIIFEEQKKDEITPAISKSTSAEDSTEIYALEQELDSTKEYLRSTIEELEVSNEELKSTNEELQSANEELQSTNEELETSKEELQSVNEEMITVNTELQGKIDELADAYNDMNNLLSSTEIGTIFLDKTLKIRRFTPATTKIINLIQTDVGRPVSHLTSNLMYKNLTKDVEEVLDKLIPIKTQAKSSEGIWYQIKIVPYRTTENLIDGVVLTFVDISEEKKALDNFKETQENYIKLMKHTKTIIFEQDEKLKYTKIFNPPAGLKNEDLIGRSDLDLFKNKKEREILKRIKEKVIQTKSPIRKDVIMTFDGKSNNYDLKIVSIIDNNDQKTGIAGIATDITELVTANEKNNE